MVFRNNAFLGQVPIVRMRIGITAEEYARELQEFRSKFQPPPAPSPPRYVSCIPSWEDRQARERICRVLEAANSAQTPQEDALYTGEFKRQWNMLLDGQKKCMPEWIRQHCPQLMPEFRRQIEPPLPPVSERAPVASVSRYGATRTPIAACPPGTTKRSVPPYDCVPNVPSMYVPPEPNVMPFAPTTVPPAPPTAPPTTETDTATASFRDVATPGTQQCPDGFVQESATGRCVPESMVATGYRRPSSGLISAGLTLGPGTISAPMLGRYRVVNLI